jgi:glycosyltransferase involved in cell wall biosynthesis
MRKSTKLTEHIFTDDQDLPLVSIFNWVFNHKDFIRDSIESILMQETNFKVEIIIHDDASTDGTKEIVCEYQQSYPHLFKNVLQVENQWSQGKSVMDPLFEKPRGKYIALTHGDDYWTDPLKLQKQVDFLEKNDDFSFSFHRSYILTEGSSKLSLSNLNTSLSEVTYTITDLAKGNFIYTGTVVFRNKLFDKIPDWFNDSPIGDYPLHMLNAKHGKIKYFPEIMAVYRKHAGGVWSLQGKRKNFHDLSKTLDLLLTENFSERVLTNLLLQKKRIINEHLRELFEENKNSFIEELKEFSDKDASILYDWAFEIYPSLIQSYCNTIEDVKKMLLNIEESRTYKITKKINSLRLKLNKK